MKTVLLIVVTCGLFVQGLQAADSGKADVATNAVWSVPVNGVMARLMASNRTATVGVSQLCTMNLMIKNVSTNLILITDQPVVPTTVRDASGNQPEAADSDFDGMYPRAALVGIPPGEERTFRLRVGDTNAAPVTATFKELKDRSGIFELKPGKYILRARMVCGPDTSLGGWTGTIELPLYHLDVSLDTYFDVYSRDNRSR